tara:strand:- start:1510 stop:6696 length:5187 start_codon:yes stop_codon:yes gene_type:complete
MIINSGVTNITRVPAFELGDRYDTYDVVYYSGYDESDVSYPCTPAESGHYYYSGASATTATASNRPAAASTEWTTGFFFQPSYGATVDYKGLQYGTEYGDGYYTVLNKSENAVRATFNVVFEKRTDKETKAIIHMLENSFNKGKKPNGGYSGINWTPFPPYNHSGEFFVESFQHSYDSPDVNTVSTSFFNETTSLTDWKQLYIPYSNTREAYENDRPYFQNDATFLRKSAEFPSLLESQSGWYYFNGKDDPGYGESTGLMGAPINSPTGAASLWTKNNFSFDINQNIQIPQNPIFNKAELTNDFVVRASEGINKNLLAFSVDFKGRSDHETQGMIHFLEHHKGTNLFKFTPPAPYDFTDKVFLAASWSHTLNFKDNNDIRVDMREFPVDYLNLSTDFLTLVTVVNRPVLENSTEGPGSISTSQRVEGLDFVSNTGLSVYAITGQVLRTGFYLTNSGNSVISTTAAVDSPYTAFEFPSGVVTNPQSYRIRTKPGHSSFIPFYFKGLQDNVTGPPAGVVGGPNDGVYTGLLELYSVAEDNGQLDPSGTIKVGITGYTTGWDVNPYRGNDGQTPMHPHKFLIQTGYYDISGVPSNSLSWEHPATGHDLTRYSVQYTQDSSWEDVTGITTSTVSPTGFPIYTQQLITQPLSDPAKMYTDLYTGLLVPPSLMGDSSIPEKLRNLPDPQNTGVRQSSFFHHPGVFNHGQNYYYRMRSEYVPWNSSSTEDITGSMYVYASGVSDLNREGLSSSVLTGLSTTSSDYAISKTVIPAAPKPAFRIYLGHEDANLNLSGIFIQELVDRGILKQEGGVDMNPKGRAAIDVANTGTYADNFSGIQWILSEDYRVGSTDSTIPAITTGGELVTGVVDVADAGAGADPNLQKPLAETPSVLVMKANSAVVGAGGVGGDGGYTVVSATLDATDFASFLEVKTTPVENSQPGGDGGDCIYISDPNIAKFKIRKDYNAKIYAGGGGGGGGDRFLVERLFSTTFNYSQPSYNQQLWDRINEGWTERMYGDVHWEPLTEKISFDPVTGDIKVAEDKGKGVPEGVHFRASNFLGTHRGGAGGGGAGFTLSLGGKQYSPKDPEDGTQGSDFTITLTSQGGFKQVGLGNTGREMPWATEAYKRFSRGGDGGDYGQDGQEGQRVTKESTGYPYTLEEFADADTTEGKLGGSAGKAIRVTSGSTYTSGNFREKLLVLTPSFTKISEIPGLVGHFDASSLVYKDDGVTAAEANTGTPADALVQKWIAKNDANVYLEQTTTANKPILRDGDFSDTAIEGIQNTYFMKLKHSYFNNRKYIYFQPSGTVGTPVIQYFKLHNATADASNNGDIKVNFTNGYAVGDHTSVGIEIDAPASYPIQANTLVNFTGGGSFKVSTALASGTSLKGVLSGNRIENDELGYYRLSSLSTGFDIFYLMYPNNWISGYVAGFPDKIASDAVYAVGVTTIDVTITGTVTMTAGNTIVFANQGRFLLSADAPANTGSAVTLLGTLSTAGVGSGEKGSVERSLSAGNRIKDRFTVQYPDAIAQENYKLNDAYAGIDKVFQTGWVRFSDQKGKVNSYYDRKRGSIQDNTGLGAIYTPLRFNDWTVNLSRGATARLRPTRSWIYNLGARYKRGIIDIRAKNNGNLVGSASFAIEDPEKSYLEFNASGDVFIGKSFYMQDGQERDQRGFRGGIAAIVIYNRKLSNAESRVVMGNLLDQYIHIKSQSTSTLNPLEKNRPNDLNGIAGHVWFEPTP